MMPLDLEVADASVRPWRRGDEASIVRHADNRKVWINLSDGFPNPYTLLDAEAWIGWVLEQDPVTHFAIAIRDEVAGGIGFHLKQGIERRSAEIGFWLGEPFWGKGITTAAVRAVTEFAFATYDLNRVFARVFEWNTASTRVLEKCGYMQEARLRKAAVKDGKTIDVYLYATIR